MPRPGGYVATGGHGGILGGVGGHQPPVLLYLPATRHTYKSEVNISNIPASVAAVRATARGIESVTIPIKDRDGRLKEDAIPSVSIVKDGGYGAEDFSGDPALEVDIIALMNHKMSLGRLAGFVVEGLVPYGTLPSSVRQKLMLDAVFSGLPVVRVGRGYPQGFADPHPHFIPGSNLTSTKARMLLMAALMRFGSLPPAKDPANPTRQEMDATAKAVSAYQEVFATH
jgi:L-asparaginase